ncbi:MAG: hypothetical protein PHT12_04465 [Patescibacteria group bacterium]|nr:hypothetical protein [Patescibacteria group bacterium]
MKKIGVKRLIELTFLPENRDSFVAIRDGRKKIETRAAIEKYRVISPGDRVLFTCGKERFTRRVTDVRRFRGVAALVRKYGVRRINPNVHTEKELQNLYRSFPGYREKLRKHGLIAIGLI